MAGPTVSVRVVHLVPDMGQFDFCLAPKGSGMWFGPILRMNSLNPASYQTVTSYVTVPAIALDTRFVDPTTADCTKPITGDFKSNGLTPPPGVQVTAGVAGDYAPSL